MQPEPNKTLDGVPLDFIVRLAEAFLSESQVERVNASLNEREFGGVPMKLVVNDHWAGFERFMLVGRDWQCGFNLSPPQSDEDDCYNVFASRLALTNAALNGRKGFARDMTVLRMTSSDWMLEHQQW